MVAAQSMGGSTVSQDAWQLGKGFLPWAWATTAVPKHVYEIKIYNLFSVYMVYKEFRL